MRLILDKQWNEFREEFVNSETELILFGASSCANIFLNGLSEKFKVKYIIDNDKISRESVCLINMTFIRLISWKKLRKMMLY